MPSDSFLFDAGWLFFALLTAVIAALSIAAFGRDLLPSKAPLDSALPSRPQESPTSTSRQHR